MPGVESHRSLGRLMRLVDDCHPVADEIDFAIRSTVFRAARIGLTGPPGAGKSSLIACVLENISAIDKRAGILAIDPTSPFTGGALLGDRVRLKGPTSDNVFFRSLASRGAYGGISASIWQSARLLDWWGADVILIETVGSGQLGTSVGDVADIVVAVLTPETGDGIQSMKAGIMELADCFIVNKSDRSGSELLFRELNHVKKEAESVGRRVEVFSTSAVESSGIDEAFDGARSLWLNLYDSGEITRRRKSQIEKEIAFRLEAGMREMVIRSVGGMETYSKAISGWVEKIFAGDATSAIAANELGADLF